MLSVAAEFTPRASLARGALIGFAAVLAAPGTLFHVRKAGVLATRGEESTT